MFWAPVCDGKSEARDFRGTGVCEIIAHLKRLWWFPPLPPRSKVEQLACQPERQRLRNKRPEFKRTSANIFQLWIWGRGGGKCFEKHKIQMGDYFADTGTRKIVQLGFGIATPGPNDKLTSLVLFSVPCRSPQRIRPPDPWNKEEPSSAGLIFRQGLVGPPVRRTLGQREA